MTEVKCPKTFQMLPQRNNFSGMWSHHHQAIKGARDYLFLSNAKRIENLITDIFSLKPLCKPLRRVTLVIIVTN